MSACSLFDAEQLIKIVQKMPSEQALHVPLGPLASGFRV